MPLLALFSDVHGNTQALEHGLRYFARRGASGYLQLGDLGGAAPLALLAGLPVQHVFGNWEVSGLPNLPAPLRPTVAAWPAQLAGPGWIATHATPAFPPECNTTEATRVYMAQHQPRWLQLFPSLLLDENAVALAFAELAAQARCVAFHGHTHVQAAQRLTADNRFVRVDGPLIDLPPDTLTLIGIGSLGAPRDGNAPRCALFDTDAMQVELVGLE